MKTFRFIIVLFFSLIFFSACREKNVCTTAHVTLEDYDSFKVDEYATYSHRVRVVIDSMIRNDKDELTADFRTRSYYLHEGDFLWVNRHGVTTQADTLLEYLRQVKDMGFSPKRFCVKDIEENLQRMRNLDFDEKHSINQVLGCLEYQLTKAYLRYSAGQRFGYLNPTYLFNRIDTLKPNRPDTIKRAVRYRGLFDVKMEHAGQQFFVLALRKITTDSVPAFLRDIQPKSPFYLALLDDYKTGEGDKAWRARVWCNMERSRWRLADSPDKHKRYVLVNIPSFHLMAVDNKDTLSMRIGCGSYATKTPLLTSAIKRMDVNPKWIVPRSIVEKDMIHYFSRSYCERRGFYVMDRSTGKEVDMNLVHRGMLLDKQYAIVQRGGKGNSLGRLIFRFDNNFSVYLHDTPSRDFFNQTDRGVSHGCVRVEKPFELAKFILKDKDEKFFENLNYCMTADSLTEKKRIIGSVKVKPALPLFLTYYTLYPLNGEKKSGWVSYPDVYGYDKVIYDFLMRNYR